METVADFIFLGSKITVDNDCSHEIKRHFLLGRKAMTSLDSISKSRDTISILPTKVCTVKPMVFPVVMHGCEGWTIKRNECQRIDAFELWCWKRLLSVPWTTKRSNQSILKEINPEYSLEGLMLKLKFQYFGHLMWRTDSLGKSLMLGKIESKKRRRQERMKWLEGITQWTWIWVNSGKQRRTGEPAMLQFMGRVGHDLATEQSQCTCTHTISHHDFMCTC